jgi:hypothetical protein
MFDARQFRILRPRQGRGAAGPDSQRAGMGPEMKPHAPDENETTLGRNEIGGDNPARFC